MLWLIVGLIVGAGAVWLVSWTRARKISVTWYEWLIVAVAVAFVLFGIQNFEGSMAELETRAAWTLLAASSFGAAVLGVVAWRLIARHNPKAA